MFLLGCAAGPTARGGLIMTTLVILCVFVSASIGGIYLLIPRDQDRRRRRAYRREVLNHMMPRKQVDSPPR
jgi:hypothetical protein